MDYPPLFGNRDTSSYFPGNTGDIIPFSGRIIELIIPGHTIEMQPPVFEVISNDLDPTPIKGPDMLDNNVPFETPVDITLHEPGYTELQTDMKKMVLTPPSCYCCLTFFISLCAVC